ncbi:MAG: glycoside hydrolase family 38 C-terminal domain-containing protein, partial [Acidobacteriaceae bacterium]
MTDAGGVSRRDFLVGGATAIGAFAAPDVLGQTAASTDGSRRVLHIIGYSHIDAAWMWPWRDGSNVVLNTVRSALDRMKETPGFHYSESSSIHYKWVQEAYPAMFAEILHRIREGRWEVVGGWPVETDCNIPSTESFVRSSLYGKQYCQRNLGVDVKIGFNPDSFGHAEGLPTILKEAGYNYYVFMRPQPEERSQENTSAKHPTPLLFWWEGPDGSRVLALRILHSYDNAAKNIPKVADISFAPGFTHGAFFWGVGDHGGEVTKEEIRQVLELQNDPSLPELRWSTVQEFFTAVESSPGMANLPVVRGGLQHHARGCYSANGDEKYQNRRAERSMVETESLAWLTGVTLKRPYPKPEFENAWWNIHFNQFHDLLAGSAIYSDYQDARDGLGAACQTATATKVESLESIAKQVDTSKAKGALVFVFNPLPWPRRALLQYIFHHRDSPITYLKAQDGTKIPVQTWPFLSAWVDLPPFGYRVFSEESDDALPPAPSYGTSITISDNSFGVTSLKVEDGAELLASQIGLVAIKDDSDTWSHGVDHFWDEIGRPSFVSSEMIEDGPVLRLRTQRLRWQESDIAVDISTFPGLDIVRLHFVIDWRQHHQILKLEIPTAMADPKVFAMVPGAVATWPTNGYEQPYHDWVAVEGTLQGKDYTVALMNNCTYSYDCQKGVLRTILIRSAEYVRLNSQKPQRASLDAWQDQGRQERTFWLVGRQGKYTDLNLDRLSNELQMPTEYVMDSRHGGKEPWEKSYLEIKPSSVSVVAIKRAENSDAMIVRLQERAGKHTTAHLESALLRLKSDVALKPWELKTLRIETVKDAPAQVRAVS